MSQDDSTLPEVTAASNLPEPTMALMDLKNKAVVHTPYSQVEHFISSGQYSPEKGTRIPVINPQGEMGSIDASEAKLIGSGYRMPTAEELHAHDIQKQYGDTGGQLKAAAAGAARGATFGLSDQLLTKSGAVAPETLAGLQEANPVASGAGEAAGIIAPALVPGLGEAGLAVEGAQAAGRGAERFLGKQALKAGLTNPVAKSIVEKIAPKVVGSAVEGAFYGAGNLVSEDALGKADFNAESLASNIGAGALIGGAFGAAFGAGSELLQPTKQVLGAVASPFESKISHALDSDVATARLFGQTPTQYAKFAQRNPKIASEMKDFLVKDLKLSLGDTAESLSNKLQDIKESSSKEIGNVLGEIDTALIDRPDLKPSAKEVFGNIYNEIDTKVYKPLTEVMAPGSKGAVREIESFMAEVKELQESGKEFKASDLQALKRAEDKLIKFNKVPGQWGVGDEMRYLTRTAVRDEIDLLAGKLESQGLSGDLAGRLKTANRAYASSATLGPFLETRALKAADRGFHWVNMITDAATDMSRKLLVLGKIEGAQQSITKAISNTADALMKPIAAVKASTVAPLSSALMTSELARDFTSDKAKKPRTKEEAYNNIVTNLSNYQQKPDDLMNRIIAQTSNVAKVAPKTAAQLNTVAFNALGFLSQKVPKSAATPAMLDYYKPAKMPSSLEVAKFERYLTAIQKPQNVLTHINNGTVSREEIDVLKNVYPSMFGTLRESVIKNLPHYAAGMPYNRRIQLGLLFDVAADQTMHGQNVLGLQSNFASQEPQNSQSGGAVKPSQAGLKNLNVADREKSVAEDIADGDDD